MNLSKQQEEAPIIQKGIQLTKQDKIYHFDMLSWASAGATLVSIWQIIIPFTLFSLNKPQLILGITSIFFLLISLVVLYWSHKGYNFYKKDKNDEQMPLQAWHIEGLIYVISFILIALYASCFFGILENEGYSWALMAAQGVPVNTAQKEAFIIVLSQLILILVDLVLLAYYAKVSYHLEFQPMNLPSLLGWFLTIFIFMCCITIGDTNYLPSKLGGIVDQESMEKAKGAHTSIFWTCLIGLIFSLFTLFEQRSIQQEVFPKVKFYFLPFLLIMVASVFLISNSLNFLYASSQSIQELKKDCKSTIQTFSQTYIDSIGCPAKYKTVNIQGSNYFDMYCQQDEVGIVWENEVDKPNSEKRNQLACMNLSCCYLVSEERTLFYKQYFFYSILTAFLGFIAAGHCFDIALQEPNVIKAGPSVYSQTQYIVQIVLALFSIILGIYLSIKYNQKVPIKMPEFNYKDQINLEPKYFTNLTPLSSIPQCQEVRDQHNKAFKVHFDHNACAGQAKCSRMGFYACLESQNGIFQLLPTFQDQEIAIFGSHAYDPYVLQQALHGEEATDKLCFEGLEGPINQLLNSKVYVCHPPDKEATVRFSTKEKEIIFEQMIQYQEEEFDTIRTVKLPRLSHQKRNHKDLGETGEEESLGQYTTVTIIVSDAETFEPIVGATVTMYQDVEKCQELNQNLYYPIRIAQTNSTGMISIYNVQMKDKRQTFNLVIRQDGYMFNCLISDHLKPFKQNIFHVPLVKSLTDQQEMKVLLWHQNPKLNLELGANVLLDKNQQCSVGFFFSECSFMKFTSHPKSQNQVSRVITLEKIIQFTYIFFVRHIPINSDIIEVVNNKGLSLVAKLQAELQSEIEEFQKAQPKVSIYSKKNPYPHIHEMPHTLSAEIDTTPDLLIWLSFCMNGKVGPESSAPINHFWEKKDESKFWQRHTVQPNTIPDSSICDKMYKQQQ
ncbi:unnamed protein product [Paramecium octaurelia]|uniref:Transmembrane protein n=1 Tax=Paramecium octaurelia TaxID=43137 RepID=A0A8S1VR44_PAROT|nr:unnamed protein product [Paramecium octaurelia]